MANQAYSIARASAAYAVLGGVAWDLKQGLAENGITINLDEDFGERIKGAAGDSLWVEFATCAGEIVIEYIPNSPSVTFFENLHQTQRATGTTGLDTITLVDRDMGETTTASNVAIKSITGATIKKSKSDNIVVTLSCGEIKKLRI